MQTTSRWSKNSIRFIHIPMGECQDIYCCPFRVKTTFHEMHVSWNSWLTLSIFVALLYSPRTNLTYLDDTNLTALTTLLTTRVSVRDVMQSCIGWYRYSCISFGFSPPPPFRFELALIEVSATGLGEDLRNRGQISVRNIFCAGTRTISDIKTDKAARFVIYFCNGNIQIYRYVDNSPCTKKVIFFNSTSSHQINMILPLINNYIKLQILSLFKKR